MNEQDWQPAIISRSVLPLHKIDPGFVTRHAGKVVRVRRNAGADSYDRMQRQFWLDCRGEGLELHPEDAALLFPEIETRVCLCTCYLLMD